jgi:hypothetical protein
MTNLYSHSSKHQQLAGSRRRGKDGGFHCTDISVERVCDRLETFGLCLLRNCGFLLAGNEFDPLAPGYLVYWTVLV